VGQKAHAKAVEKTKKDEEVTCNVQVFTSE